jgi:hypothetical protein
MTKNCLISVIALGLLGSALCHADIVVNEGLPAGCPSSCLLSISGQPDLANPGSPTSAQQFTLTSPVDITSITFWTYDDVSTTGSVPFDWSITDPSSHTIGSGTDVSAQQDALGLVTDLYTTGVNVPVSMPLSMFTIDLPAALLITPNPGPEIYTLNLQFLGAQSSYFWGEAADDQHYAFQLDGTSSAVVPEPSYTWFAAGGLGLLAAFRIRKKR